MVPPQSPFSPHGAIGQPITTPSSPNNQTTSLPSSSQPKTPGVNGEFDVAALIAHAARQHEEKKSNTSYTNISSFQPLSTSSLPVSGNGVGVIGDGFTPKRSGVLASDDIWSDQAFKRTYSGTTAIPGAPGSPVNQPNTNNNINNNNNSIRSIAPLPLFQPFESINSPFPKTHTPSNGATNRDVGTQIHGHLDALANLVTPLLAAQEEVERLRKEVELWRGEWGKGEKERKRLESIVEEQSLVVSNKSKSGKFSVVLIDGDGLIFQDSLLQAGFQGGQSAAKTLLTALPNLNPGQISPIPSHREIVVNANGTVSSDTGSVSGESREIGSVVVQLFVNKSGLGTALVKAGVVPSWGVYESFWQGFSAAHELFTVIDVGNGKEASDAKIKEYLRLYAKNAQCEMIVLGASHDNGYANILSSLQTESRLSKLLLLKGYNDLAFQLRQYSSRVVSIPELFRSSKVPNSAPQSFSAVLQATTSAPAPARQTAQNAQKEANAKKGPESEISGDASDTDDSVEVIEWEAVTKPSKEKGKKEKAIEKGKKGKKEKENGNGGDDWYEATRGKMGKKYKGKGGVAVTSVRNLKPRPCHTYYLSPWGCKVADDCDYGHNFRLTENQLSELARLAKEIICPYVRTNKCHFTEEECVYGHVCPRGRNCSFGDTCRFNVIENAHGEDD